MRPYKRPPSKDGYSMCSMFRYLKKKYKREKVKQRSRREEQLFLMKMYNINDSLSCFTLDCEYLLLFFLSFQGAIVSLVFCIFNGEVRMTGKNQTSLCLCNHNR